MARARRVALVTGGARGIGKVIAADLAKDHDLALTCHTSSPEGLSKDVLVLPGDLTKPDAPAQTIAAVMARFGKIDVIVNNAGAISASSADTYDMDALRGILDLNLLVPYGLLAAALPHLQPGAAVVSLSSVNAVLPPKGASMYGASKAALDLWTRAMAKELGPQGIRVNAVAPGAINVDEAPRDAALTQAFVEMTALGRLATAQDIADAVRFLSSEAASSITGEVLTVSGGYRL